MPASSLYRRDLAYVHHEGFGNFSLDVAPGLLRILRRAGIRQGTIADLACGSGLWAREAVRAGFEVIGVDGSPAMVRLARETAPAARFHCASLHDFSLPPCEAVTALGEGLNYVSSAPARPPRLSKLFPRVAKALRPGGLFIFDVIVRAGAPMHYRSWRMGKDWTVLFEVTENRATHRLVRHIVTYRKTGTFYRRAEETHLIYLFSRAAIERALQRAGFSVRVTNCYGAYPLATRRLAFIARKRDLPQWRSTDRSPSSRSG